MTDGIAYDERGSGPALVLVHGHSFNRSMWHPQLAGLGGEFRVIAPDLPGYGESAPREDPMTMRAFADAVIELLDLLEVERAVVVGLSMGGLVAMELGLGYPHRVDGVVLAATTAEPVTPQEAQTRRATADLAHDRGMLPLAAEMAGRLFGPRAERDGDLVLSVFAMMLASPPDGAAAALRGRALRPDYSTLLGSLTVPALVIAGDHDGYAPDRVVRQLVGSLPDPQVLHFEKSGHLPNLEEPERFNDAVRTFAATASPGFSPGFSPG